MKLRYDISDKPRGVELITLAFQQMLTILAATIAVPVAVGNGLSPAPAMFGAGMGSLVYFLFTKGRSPVFLGSSFTFVGAMLAAFAGGVSMQLGMAGLVIGAAAAGAVYVILALIVRKVGTGWINKVMPAVVIGPVVSVIGLSLAAKAVGDIRTGNVISAETSLPLASPNIALVCGLITLAATMIFSVYGKGSLKLVPFLIGIAVGYAAALIFTLIGNATGTDILKIIDLGVFGEVMMPDGEISFASFISLPRFVFMDMAEGSKEITVSYVITIITAYVPIAFVGFAEHIADHKNLSSIVGRDLLKDPGLHRTLLGDGVGSIAGAIFGGCANTTYGESIACVALTGNASSITILAASVGCILLSFLTPFVAFVESVPKCVMGGLCVALYGFIAVSGLKMIKHIDFDDNRNIFVASVILITGIGGLSLNFGSVTITEVAASLILGVLANVLLSGKKKQKTKETESEREK